MKIKVLLNRMKDINQDRGGAAKNSGRELRLLELKSEPWKELGRWWSHLLCASQAIPGVPGLLLDPHSEKKYVEIL